MQVSNIAWPRNIAISITQPHNLFLVELGLAESEEDRIEKYILTKFPDAKFTPSGKSGYKVEFGKTKTERFYDEIIIENSLSQDQESGTSEDESEESSGEDSGSDMSSEN